MVNGLFAVLVPPERLFGFLCIVIYHKNLKFSASMRTQNVTQAMIQFCIKADY